jgi:hypothetical protein
MESISNVIMGIKPNSYHLDGFQQDSLQQKTHQAILRGGFFLCSWAIFCEVF